MEKMEYYLPHPNHRPHHCHNSHRHNSNPEDQRADPQPEACQVHCVFVLQHPANLLTLFIVQLVNQLHGVIIERDPIREKCMWFFPYGFYILFYRMKEKLTNKDIRN
ncbi:MAG: hypothetical protein MJY96_03450 [Bacteroidaceae bacterium]|nr:hypothetical protein [Bacteroidaceae bacterium]